MTTHEKQMAESTDILRTASNNFDCYLVKCMFRIAENSDNGERLRNEVLNLTEKELSYNERLLKSQGDL
jgi:hypothetical protein